MTFGICALVVIEAGITFHGAFEEAQQALEITVCTLSGENHKVQRNTNIFQQNEKYLRSR